MMTNALSLFIRALWLMSPDRLARFFYNDTAPTEIYTLSLHDALPISRENRFGPSTRSRIRENPAARPGKAKAGRIGPRSEEHTSELQSQSNLVCRLLLEKKNLVLYMVRTMLLPSHAENVIVLYALKYG